MQTATVTPIANTPKSNSLTLDEILAFADTLGELEGKGAETSIQFALKLVEGAYHGTLDLKLNKHGADRDDAVHVSERFFKARNKAKVFSTKSRSIQKMVSDHRKMIKLGGAPNFGRGQPMQSVNEFCNHIQGLQAKNTKGLDDAYNALKRFATAQLKAPTLLTDDVRNAFAFKNAKGEPTEMEKLIAIRKALDKTGDKSTEIVNAKHQITLRITAIVKGSR
jgi:hypothetical protein